MIRPININLNAAHPELPLVEATTFTGAPSSVFIRGVPKAVGNWSITAVSVAVTYPDNTTTARAAVESAEGVWVATIPSTATSGRTAAGFRILADGIDENGAAVTGYVLGFADFAVLSFFPVPAPGETFFYLRYFDTMPTTAKKMDVTTIDGVLKYYNGTTWLPFTDLSNYYTKAETDNAIERVAAYYITYNAAGAAFPTRADLINAQTYYSGGVVRVPTRNDYAVVLADETHDGAEWRYIYAVADGEAVGQWEAQYPVEGVIAYDNNVTPTSGNGVKSSGIWAAIWGALSALPTGFSSLYDWCVAQLAGKLSLSGGTMQGDLGVNGHDIDITNNGRVIVRSTDGHVAIFANDGIDISSDGSITWTHFDWPSAAGTLALVSQIPNISGKADKTELPYAISASIPLTVTGGAASTTLTDRMHNVRTVAAPGSGNTTTITATLPPIVAGKSRDMFLNLTVGTQASDAGDISLSIVEPSGATVQIDIGSVEDIGIGKNEILISENALPTTSGNVTTTHWLVTVRHEDFAS